MWDVQELKLCTGSVPTEVPFCRHTASAERNFCRHTASAQRQFLSSTKKLLPENDAQPAGRSVLTQHVVDSCDMQQLLHLPQLLHTAQASCFRAEHHQNPQPKPVHGCVACRRHAALCRTAQHLGCAGAGDWPTGDMQDNLCKSSLARYQPVLVSSWVLQLQSNNTKELSTRCAWA